MSTITSSEPDRSARAAVATVEQAPTRQKVPSRPRRWALVQVWNGAVLASFDAETSARRAMAWADDDEVVVVYVGS
jgi:hypothetical protein